MASEAGLRILMAGGNAVDAAVAAAAVLNVTEPMNVGIGGDLFALIYTATDKQLHAIDASGMAPTGATIARFNKLGYSYKPASWGPGSGMPKGGILDVTVPGTVWGWDAMLHRFGTMRFAQVLAPAVDYAENGFPVSERIASDWSLPNALPLRNCCTERDPDSVRTWYVNGKPPTVGQIFTNRALGHTFRELQRLGSSAFYHGEIARAIVAKSNRVGGTMTLADLTGYSGRWVTPIFSTYHGYEVEELPPPSQGFATNEALNILEQCVPKLVPGETLRSLGPANARYWHLLVEAKKLAYADLLRYNADPATSRIPLARLLSKTYASSLCSRVDIEHATDTHSTDDSSLSGDTIVLSTADEHGNMVSLVNSNYAGFGSGITVPGYGFILHNRGGLFTLKPDSPNAIAPHKRPFNTLAASMLLRDGRPFMTLGVMGGTMQAQGHEQIIVDMLDLDANVQQAGDMARFYHAQQSNTLYLESSLYQSVGEKLKALGHNVKAVDRSYVGGYQAIAVLRSGPKAVFAGGSDFAKDGAAVGW